MEIDSNRVIVPTNQQEIYDFLKDANNLIHLLPKDNVSDYKATTDSCSFKVQGGVVISLIHDGEEGIDKIFMKSGAKSPFPFRLTIQTSPSGDGTEGHIHFDGEVNMFLKMMVEKPLTNLFNYMSNKLKEHFS
ncbi:MAG: carbon monoxide dehydrogenase subunit G [Crocinitomicaceae bacterium]|jgi:carbon monoxide dehydrogenase subunit G